MAKGAALAFAQSGHDLFLAGRNSDELDRIGQDIALRTGVQVLTGTLDADAVDTHADFIAGVNGRIEGIYGVLFAIGDMGAQAEAEQYIDQSLQILQRNYAAALTLLNPCANLLQEAGRGFIIGISSVAGDRGRQSNFIYGAAKGALTIYLQGLRNRLCAAGVRVITIKPGFVDTAMTFGLPGLFLVANPTQVGQKIAASPHGRSDTLYLPKFWRYIMWIICSIPEPIFKRLKL